MPTDPRLHPAPRPPLHPPRNAAPNLHRFRHARPDGSDGRRRLRGLGETERTQVPSPPKRPTTRPMSRTSSSAICPAACRRSTLSTPSLAWPKKRANRCRSPPSGRCSTRTATSSRLLGVPSLRRKRHPVSDLFPARRRASRQPGRDPLDDRQVHGARPGQLLLSLRTAVHRLSGHGCMGVVRAWDRESQPAGLCSLRQRRHSARRRQHLR